MAGLAARQRRNDSSYYWPGFVDAMAQLLLVITFLLSVFMIAQFLLAREITGQDTVLSKLRSQISELTSLLSLEKSAKSEIVLTLATLADDLQSARGESGRLQGMLDTLSEKGKTSGGTISNLRTSLDSEQKINIFICITRSCKANTSAGCISSIIVSASGKERIL